MYEPNPNVLIYTYEKFKINCNQSFSVHLLELSKYYEC